MIDIRILLEGFIDKLSLLLRYSLLPSNLIRVL